MEKTPEEHYRERTKRFEDTIQLKVPDRVPILVNFGFFAARHAGITCEQAFYDCEKWKMAYRKTIVDFQPDIYRMLQFTPGKALEAVDCRMMKWPGHGVPPDQSFQFIEGDFMKGDEYDAFLDDPSDYAVRTFMPRVYGTLEPLKMLPPLRSMLFGVGPLSLTSVLANPELVRAFESLSRAGREVLKWHAVMGTFDQEMADLGFPSQAGGMSSAPFDIISDFFRGMRMTMLDMFRRPDKIIESCEKLLPMMIERGITSAKMSRSPRVFIPLHRGSEGFMSMTHFESLYWPTLKRLILALIEQGLTPCPFFEGDYTSRLEYVADLPKGKVMALFDTTDLIRAKEILKDRICIAGNVPLSLLQTGTADDVKEHCKKLIDVVGKDGGFIMSPRGALDGPKAENVRAMIDFTKVYGVYR